MTDEELRAIEARLTIGPRSIDMLSLLREVRRLQAEVKRLQELLHQLLNSPMSLYVDAFAGAEGERDDWMQRAREVLEAER